MSNKPTITQEDIDSWLRAMKQHVDAYKPKSTKITYAKTITCPDCNGSGVYTGLHETEICDLCKGAKVA